MSLPRPTSRPGTYVDLLRVPDHLVAELVDGELYTTPRPAPRHADASSSLGGLLHGPFDRGRGGSGGWRILFEPELHLGPDVVVPDLAGWRRARLPRLPDEAYFSLAPDWICEVLSPSTAALDRVKKLTIYARERVEWVWLIEPIAKTLEVLHREDARWLIASTHEDADVVRVPPFESLEFDLSTLWDPPAAQT